MRRAVITGLGAVTPLGHSVETTWSALLSSRSGIQRYLNDPVLKNDKPFNLALVKDFEFSKWKAAVDIQ
jgi:3-oxoacyl-[acyl-carrier-protein] synthase II